MYLKRKIDIYLKNWKNSGDKMPLIIKGARQIGKTESVRKFAKENYENFIEINFALEIKYRSIIEDGYDVASIIKNISRIDPHKKFIENKTLIFFDELQDFPQIASSLKFFNADGRFDVICSGSMLGINYQKIESNSVGNKIDFLMQSIDFEEFLWAKGYPESIADELLQNLITLKPFSESELKIFNSVFLDYCILGGMPAIVSSYIEKGTFEGSLMKQRALIEDYKEDFRKYVTGLDQTRVLNVFNHIPVQLAKENKKFQISKVATGARFKDYFGCVEWLNDAGIINICRCLNFPELPLNGNYDDTKYKIYFKDTGLLVACLDEEAQEDLRSNKNLGVYKGALYENFVGEALSKSGYNLFYYKREDSTLEEDFFLRTKKSLVPVEVKASNNRSRSLSELIKNERYADIKYGIKLCRANIGFENNIYTFPYFCAFLLKRFLKDAEW
ncbi:MAG: ATP-binding protein [Bacteroidales bacterium]|nr:ATP-binding protein [Bacteroidales bacterium]MBR6278220.1 ATP-binding protein [Bacteroidales bacterium]